MAKKAKKSIDIDDKHLTTATVESKADVEYIGNQLANVSERVNELELSIESIRKDVQRVMGRMGL